MRGSGAAEHPAHRGGTGQLRQPADTPSPDCTSGCTPQGGTLSDSLADGHTSKGDSCTAQAVRAANSDEVSVTVGTGVSANFRVPHALIS